MERLLIIPDADGYNQRESGEEVFRTELQGGRGRYRRDKVGASRTVSVTWTLNPAQYQYWMAFYTTTLKKGTLPFLCALVSDYGNGPEEYEASIIPGSVGLPRQQGFVYQISATLEVTPNTHDPLTDQSIIDTYETFRDGGYQAMMDIAKLVNVTMPEDFGP